MLKCSFTIVVGLVVMICWLQPQLQELFFLTSHVLLSGLLSYVNDNNPNYKTSDIMA